MSTTLPEPRPIDRFPTHLDLPFDDGAPVMNSQEPTQSALLTETIWPVLETLHPDGLFYVGRDCGIYWNLEQLTGETRVNSPDWYYVPSVPPMLDGEIRRSYVLWVEHQHPEIVIEYVSGTGAEEHDTTPQTGKFWI